MGAFNRREHLRKRNLKEKGHEPAPFSGCEEFKGSFRFGPPRRKSKPVELKRGQGMDLDKEHRAAKDKKGYEEILRAAEVTAIRRLDKIVRTTKDEGRAMRACALVIAISRGSEPAKPTGPIQPLGAAKSGSGTTGMGEELRKAIAAAGKGEGAEEDGPDSEDEAEAKEEETAPATAAAAQPSPDSRGQG